MEKLLLAFLAFFGAVNLASAATITVSAGFDPANSIVPSVNGAAPTTFTVAVGSWDGFVFTQFGSSIMDSGSVNGSFTATGPAEVNGDVIHVWVGIGPVSTTGQMWVLLRTSTNTAFPADVSSTLASSTVNLHNSTPGTVVLAAAGDWGSLQGNQVSFIPEPSALLLGLFGFVAVLRRRR